MCMFKLSLIKQMALQNVKVESMNFWSDQNYINLFSLSSFVFGLFLVVSHAFQCLCTPSSNLTNWNNFLDATVECKG